jgi:hypothetical protein
MRRKQKQSHEHAVQLILHTLVQVVVILFRDGSLPLPSSARAPQGGADRGR